MAKAANSNDFTAARKTFLKYFLFFKAIFMEPNPVPIKYCLQEAGIIASDEVRLPLSELTVESRSALDLLMEELSLSQTCQ